MEEELATVVDQLRQVIERLDELAFDSLQAAVADGERTRPEVERRITRARHGLERAIRHLEAE